jgi:hypothetical protein
MQGRAHGCTQDLRNNVGKAPVSKRCTQHQSAVRADTVKGGVGVLVGRWSLKPEGPVQFAWLLLKHKSSIIFSASFAEAVRALSIPELPVDSTNQSLVLSHVHLDLDSVSS